MSTERFTKFTAEDYQRWFLEGQILAEREVASGSISVETIMEIILQDLAGKAWSFLRDQKLTRQEQTDVVYGIQMSAKEGFIATFEKNGGIVTA